MSGLTGDEREALRAAVSGWAPDEEWEAGRSRHAMERVVPAVERILTARLAAVEALADEWEDRWRHYHAAVPAGLVRELRAALGTATQDGEERA